jgi:single-strand DNA-binding protein
MGHLGRDPESRRLPNGDAVCHFSIAVSERWTDKRTGEKKESTEWINIVMFRRLAEIADEYLKKGAPVYIEGKMRTRKWQDKDGQDRYNTEIIANEMQMLGGRSGGGSSQGFEREEPAPARPAKSSSPEAEQPFDDDIPF